MPNHCYVCGHTDFSHWREYALHMAQSHNVVVKAPIVKHLPTKTSNRTTVQIVDALERKLGKQHFFNSTSPAIEDEYVAFMRRFKK